MNKDYEAFLESKKIVDIPTGKDVAIEKLNPTLFDFQKALVQWALRRGRAGLFTATGTGKTAMALSWAEHIEGKVLILAPLAVAHQTIREAQRMQIEEVQYVKNPREMSNRICITNYDRISHFVDVDVQGIVADEVSIIKHFDSATRKILIEHFSHIPFRLACTATPAPNSIDEIGNYAEWLGVMTLNNMRATFFVHDDTDWRLRGYAKDAFYTWLSSWSMAMLTPEDIGYDGSQFILPPLYIENHFLPWPASMLIADGNGQLSLSGTQKLHGISDRMAVRKQTIDIRANRVADIARRADGQVVIWTGLIDEGKTLMKLLKNESIVEIQGSNTSEEKEQRLLAFLDGTYKILLTKSSIAGFGINMQNAHTAIFFGLSDSWEGWYQAVRRLWRYGQKYPVTTHVVLSEHEHPIWDNVQRKEKEAIALIDGLIEAVKDYEQEELSNFRKTQIMPVRLTKTASYEAYHGDCIEVLQQIPDASIHHSVFSPPFASLFQYYPGVQDLGNCTSEKQFFEHHGYVADALLRVLIPGRIVAMHVGEIPAMLVRDGYIGLHNFRGHMVDHMVNHGFIRHGEVLITKNPQPLRDGTPVRTPSGWQPIESLDIGDEVIDVNGHATTITAIPYRGMQSMYRMVFDDGGWVECGSEHQWTVRFNADTPWKIMTTAQILTSGTHMPSGRYRYEIPIMAPLDIERDDNKLPLHPRLLGALLADGNWAHQRCVSITKDCELVESLPLPEGYRAIPRPGSERASGRTMSYGLVSNIWHENTILDGLRTLGLGNCRAWEKFIPIIYLNASLDARRALLQGLLDGDGRIHKNGGIAYRTTSQALMEGVVNLVQSLGGLAKTNLREGGKYGEGKQGRPLWEISIRLQPHWCPFTLTRKAEHWSTKRRNIHRHIQHIEYTGESPCTCITVAASDGLFVTRDYIVTHNSQAIRTHPKGLAFPQLRKDASWMRPALVDYILLFRKPGDNPIPVISDVDNDTWIRWANGAWFDCANDEEYLSKIAQDAMLITPIQMIWHGIHNDSHGIHETDTLNTWEAKTEADDKHICALQLSVIERCIRLWSNKGERILSPFGGIGSEGYVALQHGRYPVLMELKDSYYETMLKNLNRAMQTQKQLTFF